MRVAHVGNYKPDSPNGVNQTIAGLVEHLPAHGVDVELWHFTPNVRRVAERRSGPARVWDIPSFRGRVTSAFMLQRAARAFLAERRRQVDLLHLHSAFVSENGCLARAGIPYVVTPNGGYGPQVLNGRRRYAKRIWIELRERAIWERCRALHAVSPQEADELEVLTREAPVRFIPNGVPEDLTRRTVTAAGDGTYFLYLGRLAVDHKGLDVLLDAYALAARAVGADIRPLVLAGPDFREGQRELAVRAAALGIADLVQFTGAVSGEEKWNLIGRARCFVHTSRWEGMPFALLEAMSLARPVIVTPGTNLAITVRDSNCGLVVGLDVSSVAHAIVDMSRASRDRLNDLGENARGVVARKFVWGAVAAAMASVYREIVR